MQIQTGLFSSIVNSQIMKSGKTTAEKTKGKKLGPWDGICCEACWNAEEEKCTCKCGGANHGRGKTQKYEKLDDFEEAKQDEL